MAVELRCPKCKKKLRLDADPEPDSEVECPACKHVFACDENRILAGGAADDEAKPKKKKKVVEEDATDDEDEKPAKGAKGDKSEKAEKGTGKAKDKDGGDEKKDKGEQKDKPKAAGDPGKKSKKRKAKKKKASNTVLIAVLVGLVVVVGSVGGVLIWFFTKKSASQEMMTYLPDDCDEVVGVNLGHLQKYPEFYKACEGSFATKGFKKAGDVFAAALGQEFNDTFDYVVQGAGAAGGQPLEATVLKTKAEFDPSLVGKIPGAQKYTAAGVDYYTIPDVPELRYPGLRVFAPTNRLVVFCRGDMPAAKFNAMLAGNKDNPDGTPYVRGGAMAKQTTRGTVWKFIIYGRSAARPVGPKVSESAPGQPPPTLSDDDELKKEIAQIAAAAQGSGYKASVGSRETRGEWIVWYKDSSAASDMLKKWKEQEWVKDEEKNPPKALKAIANKSGIGKTSLNVVRDNLSFSSSGETFSIRTASETKLVQPGVSGLVNAFLPQPDP